MMCVYVRVVCASVASACVRARVSVLLTQRVAESVHASACTCADVQVYVRVCLSLCMCVCMHVQVCIHLALDQTDHFTH